LVSFLIHNSLQKRDTEVRRETLMNLEHYDVLGFDSASNLTKAHRENGRQCYQTKEVDGRMVSIPCHLVNTNGSDD
jgi:hypothetical protein